MAKSGNSGNHGTITAIQQCGNFALQAIWFAAVSQMHAGQNAGPHSSDRASIRSCRSRNSNFGQLRCGNQTDLSLRNFE
jgi:hypothetical protein